MSEDKRIELSNKTPLGESLQAVFLPDKGMALVSFRLDDLEILDQSTRPEFEERRAGLGPLIGPHFYRRNPAILPPLPNKERFPHIAILEKKGIQDPFPHGIGRFAPWKTKSTDTFISAYLAGKDTWNDVPLSQLEGMSFNMRMDAKLDPDGLKISLSCVSEKDSIAGIHYYYALEGGKGTVTSQVQKKYYALLEQKTIPPDWNQTDDHTLSFNLENDADFTFHPYPDPLSAKIILETGKHQLITTYTSPSQENGWQLYHPKGASFVCIEPVTAQNPRRANLTVSSIQIHLQPKKIA